MAPTPRYKKTLKQYQNIISIYGESVPDNGHFWHRMIIAQGPSNNLTKKRETFMTIVSSLCYRKTNTDSFLKIGTTISKYWDIYLMSLALVGQKCHFCMQDNTSEKDELIQLM